MLNRKILIAVLLNTFFYPVGYLYIRHKFRIIFFSIILVFYPVLESFLLMIILRQNNLYNATAITYYVEMIIRVFVMLDTFLLLHKNTLYKKLDIFPKYNIYKIGILYIALLAILKYSISLIPQPFARLYQGGTENLLPNIHATDVIAMDCLNIKEQLDRGSIIGVSKINKIGVKRFALHRLIGIPGDTIFFENNVLVINGQNIQQKKVATSKQLCKQIQDTMESSFGEYYTCQEIHLHLEELPSKLTKGLGGKYIATHIDKLKNVTLKEPMLLGANQYFILDDIRNISFDSRTVGPISFNKIQCIKF